MKFFIAIEPGNDHQAFGVVVPDLPGCFSAADTLEGAIDNSREAIALHCECLLEDGRPIPDPRPLLKHYQNDEFSGWIKTVVEVPVIDKLLKSNSYEQNWLVHPGEVVEDALHNKAWTSEKLAEQLEMEFKEIELLLAGHLDIDQELSAKLAEVFGNSAMFWLRLQRQYTAARFGKAHTDLPARADYQGI